MSKHRTEDLRNIALAGHRASGKTSLADALLFQAKAVDRKGSVDEGTSVSDFDEEEKHHRFSIDTSVLNLEHKGKHINLLDTPGAPDFVGNALGSLSAVENVVVVASPTPATRSWSSWSPPRRESRSTPDAGSTRPASADWPACSSSTSSKARTSAHS